MDAQRTIEFILQSQANAEVRMERADRQIQATANLVREGMKMVKTLVADRRHLRDEMRATREEIRESREETRKEIRELREEMRKETQALRLEANQRQIEAQRETRELRAAVADLGKTVERFVKSIGGRATNGHTKGNRP